jgi:hypothetical protein
VVGDERKFLLNEKELKKFLAEYEENEVSQRSPYEELMKGLSERKVRLNMVTLKEGA